MPATGDASIAVVLPERNYGSMFAANYWRGKQFRAAREQQALTGAVQTAAQRQKVLDGITTPQSDLMQIQQLIGQRVKQGYEQAAAEPDAQKASLIAAQTGLDAQNLVARGKTYLANQKALIDAYKADGLNGDAAAGLVSDYYNANNGWGTGDISLEAMNRIARSREGELAIGNEASTKHFNGIKSQSTSTKKNANGLRTASGNSWTVENDAEIVETPGGDRVQPKSDELVVGLPHEYRLDIQRGGQKGAAALAQVSLAELQGRKDGKVQLYDKQAYDQLVSNRAARVELQRDFNQYAQRWEAENPGYTYPRGGQIEESAKRALAFNKRLPLLESKHSEITAGPQYHISVNAGGSGSKQGSEPVVIDHYGNITNQLNALPKTESTFFSKLIGQAGTNAKLVATDIQDAATADYIIKLSESRLSAKEKQHYDPKNTYIQYDNTGVPKVYVQIPAHTEQGYDDEGKEDASKNEYVKAQTKNVATLTPVSTNLGAGQVNVKAKAETVKRGAVPPTAVKPAPNKKPSYVKGTAKGTDF